MKRPNQSCLLSFCILTSAAIVACVEAETDDKTSLTATEAPFEGDYTVEEGKPDSWRYPRDGGPIFVGETVRVRFDTTSGWIAYEIELTAGQVDIDLADDSGAAIGDVDPVLIVYGPKRANGQYPTRPLAINDDMARGNTNSHILFDAPRNGQYRIIATTYENWYYYPRNLTTDDAHLTIRCPAGGDRCGPTRAAIGDPCFSDGECPADAHCDGEQVCPPDAACFAADVPGQCVETRNIGDSCFTDGECVDGAHCEGEQVCPAGAACFAPDTPGLCVVDYDWVSYAPVQCGDNAWQSLRGAPESDLEGELGQIDAYFRDQGIALQEVGLLGGSMAVCLSCSCPRGDLLVAKAALQDAARLVNEFGFGYTSGSAVPFLGRQPVQCGGNAWDEVVEPESDGVRQWAAEAGVTLGFVGFTYSTTPIAVCRACPCLRGDRLVVTPDDVSDVEGARNLGLGDLYTP